MRFWLAMLICLTANVAAAQDENPKRIMKIALNLNRLLCAEVLEITPLKLKDKLEVTCIEYRGGTGTVRYIYTLGTGRAFKAN